MRATQILQGYDSAAALLMEPDELGRSQSARDIAADRNRRAQRAIEKITDDGTFHFESIFQADAMESVLRDRDEHLGHLPKMLKLKEMIAAYAKFAEEFPGEFEAGYFAEGLAKVCAPLVMALTIGWSPCKSSLESLGWIEVVRDTPFLHSLIGDVVVERMTWYAREFWDPLSVLESTRLVDTLGDIPEAIDVSIIHGFVVDSLRREAEALCQISVLGMGNQREDVQKFEQWMRSSPWLSCLHAAPFVEFWMRSR